MTQPISLVCIGAHREMALQLEQNLAPHFRYSAILTKIQPTKTYSPENLGLLLDVLNPTPAGVIVGGGFTDNEAAEIENVLSLRKTRDGEALKFIKVPTGTFEQGGPHGLVKKIKELLSENFGVAW